MRLIMNSNGDNESPWNILRSTETLPNVSPFDVSTVFQLQMLLPNNRQMLSVTATIFSFSFNQ